MARSRVERESRNAERVEQMGIDVRSFTPAQQQEFLAGFEQFLRGKYKGEAKINSVLNGAREFMTTVDPRKNYNIDIVPVVNEYIVSNDYREVRRRAARQRRVENKAQERLRAQLKTLTPHEVWMSLDTNFKAGFTKNVKPVEGQDWQQTVEQAAYDSIDSFTESDVNARAFKKIIGGTKKNRLKSLTPEQAWEYLSQNAQIAASKKASEGLSAEEISTYRDNPAEWQARVKQVAYDNIDNLKDDDISIEKGDAANRRRKEELRAARGLDDEADISGLSDMFDDVSRKPASRPARGPRPDLYEIEARPFIDEHRPALRRARRRAIIQGIVGVLGLGLGIDIAATTFAVVAPALAVSGALIPVVGLIAVGGAAVAFGAVNVVRAVRYHRLFRNITRAYRQTNRRGQRLSREQVERSIVRSRRLADKLGLDRSNLSVLNQGLYVYTPLRTRVAQGAVKNYRNVRAFNRRVRRGMQLHAEDRSEIKAMKKEFREGIRERRKEQKTQVRQANRAIREYNKRDKKYGAAAVHKTSRAEATRMLQDASVENARINDAKYVGKQNIKAAKAEMKKERTLKTGISPEKKQELLQRFRQSLGPDGLKEFNNLPKEEREARVKEFVYGLYNEEKLVNRVKAKITNPSRTQRTRTSDSSTNGPAMTA